MANRDQVAADLRAWGRGLLATEAAAELLIRAHGGRFADVSCPWILLDRRGRCWLDAALISRHAAGLSGGERRFLAVVEALATGGPLWDPSGVLAGLDRPHLILVLAALAHAGGGHEDVDVTFLSDDAMLVWRPSVPLLPWPNQPVRVA